MRERAGIVGYGAYIPAFRLSRGEIAAASGGRAKGARAVAGYDEDSTSMAVEAAQSAVGGHVPRSLWFATTAPAYVDKTNATAVHAALGLPAAVGAFDLGASWRSAGAALVAASNDGGLAVLSDLRDGLLGSADELLGGDGAAAFQFGSADELASLLGAASLSAEFLDRWRSPRGGSSSVWEERFGEKEYAALASPVVDEALKDSGLSAGDIDVVLVSSPNVRAAKVVAAQLAAQTGARLGSADLLDLVGNAGVAQLGLALADQLDTVKPGETILSLSLADGADAFVIRATDALVEHRARQAPVRAQLERTLPVDLLTYLRWRGRLERERPRRPDAVRPSAPMAARNVAYKYGLIGGRCRSCGSVQFPTPVVCISCRATTGFDDVRAGGAGGRIVTYTVDHLAYTPSPPLMSAVIDLDVGGRILCELTDVEPEALAAGGAVRMCFRRLMTVDGIHNYFWKARPEQVAAAPSKEL